MVRVDMVILKLRSKVEMFEFSSLPAQSKVHLEEYSGFPGTFLLAG